MKIGFIVIGFIIIFVVWSYMQLKEEDVTSTTKISVNGNDYHKHGMGMGVGSHLTAFKCDKKENWGNYVYVGQLVSMDSDPSTSVITMPLFESTQPNSTIHYYAVYGKYRMPVTYENKSCEISCKKITSGALVTVPEYAGKVFVFQSV